MAGLFRKRQFKPWIVSCVAAQEKKIKSKVVKVLCRRSNDPQGCLVMLVSDGELSISAAFPTEAVDIALSNIGLDTDTRWDNALLILQEFSLDLKLKGEEDIGEYVVNVEKFKIWDLQPGYTAKFDVKYCMEDSKVLEKMTEEVRLLKERAEGDETGSIGLSQLLDEMAKPSESSTQSSHVLVEDSTTKYTENRSLTLTQSLMEELLQPITVNEFLIPESQAQSLHNIAEWQPDYQPEGDTPSNSDQQFDVCAANTLSTPPDNVSRKCHLSERKSGQELSQSVIYLGISVSPKEQTDEAVIKKERHSSGSSNVLYKVGNSSLSQATSSHWQNELESVEFTFQDSSVTSSQVLIEELNPDLTLRNHSGASVLQSQEEFNKLVTNEICDKTNKDVPTSKNNLQVTERVTTKQTNTENVVQAKSVLKSPGSVSSEKLMVEQYVSVNENKNSKTMTEKDSDFVKTSETGNDANLEPGTKEFKHGAKELKQGTKDLKQGSKEKNSNTNICLGNRKKASDSMGKTHTMLNESNQIQRAVNTNNEVRNESFELGSPNAHSTQTNEIEKNRREDNQKITSLDVELICDSTEENVSSKNVNDTQSSQNEVDTQSLQNTVGMDQTVNKNSVMSMSGDECEVRDKVGTCSGPSSADSSLSDIDKNVMLDYYSQPSSSKSDEQDWYRVKLADQRERLQALIYKYNRWLTLDGGKGIKTEPVDTDEINLSPKRSVELFSKNIQGEQVTNQDAETQTIVSTVNSSDTGYPLVSLSLKDSVEKNSNCLLLSDESSEYTDLEEVDRILREKIANYYETGERDVVEKSQLSDIELCKDPLEQYMENVKIINERQYINDIQVNNHNENSDKHSEENNTIQPITPFTPLYFETEPGSKKRSRKLIRKVISCREKDREINSDSKGKFETSNECFVNKVNKYRKELRYFSVKKKGVSGNQTNNSQIWTQIDDNILRGVNKKTNCVQWKFKKSICIILKRCDKKEHTCGVENNQNTTGACNQGVGNAVQITEEISKQNETVNCSEAAVTVSCSETEVIDISKTVGSNTIKIRGDVSEGTFRVPSSEYDVTSYNGRKITEEKGKKINDGDTDLTSETRLVDNDGEKLRSAPRNEDKLDLNGAETIQETDYSAKDNSSARVPNDTDCSPAVVNVRNNSDSNGEAEKFQLTPAENTMATCSADTSCVENKNEKSQSFLNIVTSTFQNTQPFEICPFPETQEFVPESPNKFEIESSNLNTSLDSTMSNIIPKIQEFIPNLSEHLGLTPLSDTMATGNDMPFPGINLSDNSDKISEVPLWSKSTNNGCEILEGLGKNSSEYPSVTASDEVVKASEEKLLDKEIETEKLNKNGDKIEHVEPSTSSAVVKSTDYRSSDKGKELHSDTINADQREFTRLINKSVHHKTSNNIPIIVSPGKTLFKVKPYRKLNLQRKRKSSNDNNNGSNQVSIKKQKLNKDYFTKPFNVKDRTSYSVSGEEHTASVSKMLVDYSDNSCEEYVVIGIPTRTCKTLTKTADDDDKDIVKDTEKLHDKERTGKACKKSDHHKIYVDGNCCGNILKQNYIESSYHSASCETKNKYCVEKTNMRKSSLDSSQGSGRTEIQECFGQVAHTSVVNMSPESQVSEENNNEVDKDNSSPESVSLLTSKKQLEQSNVRSKVSLEKQTNQTKLKEPIKVLNNTASKGTNSDLVFTITRVNGLLRFNRQNLPENTINMQKKVSENVKTRGKQKNTKINSINYDKHLFNHSAKGMSRLKQIKNKENTNKEDKYTNIETKKSNLTDIEVLDKNKFVKDWLMRNNKIGEQSTSTIELSSPDNETVGGSVPSCQPVCGCGQQPLKDDQVKCFLISGGLDEEPQGKDNSSCDSSSAVSSSSVNSEDLKKPMSAAARYLLKFKKARRERKKRELIKKKLEKRPTV